MTGAEGEAVVIKHRMGPGEYFGERALVTPARPDPSPNPTPTPTLTLTLTLSSPYPNPTLTLS